MKIRKGKLGVVLLIITIGYFLFTLFSVYMYSKKDNTQKADAAVVLGTAIWGNKPSPVFEERIKHGINLYQSGIVDNLIFTGGIGQGQKFSEAEIGRKYALEKGIPSQRIFIEEKSTITDENLKYAKSILQENNFEKVLIVSDPLHMKRAMLMSQNHNLNAFTSPTKTSRYQSFAPKLGFAFREAFFLIGYRIHRIFN